MGSSPTSDEARRFDLLVNEADQVGTAAREYALSVTAVLSLVIIATAATITFGLTDRHVSVVIAAPVVLAGLLVYMTQLLTEYELRVGVRLGIERILARDYPELNYRGSQHAISDAFGKPDRTSALVASLIFGTALVIAMVAGLVASVPTLFPARNRLPEAAAWGLVIAYWLAAPSTLGLVYIANVERSKARGLAYNCMTGEEYAPKRDSCP